MDSENASMFFVGFCASAIISIGIMFACFSTSNTEISREIVNNIQQSTNIVEALKNENLVIKKVCGGYETDTVKIVVEYDFLYKNSKIKAGTH